MRIAIYRTARAILMVGIVNILVIGAPFGSVAGTSDTGGANGVSGRIYDSYIVDPTKLPAFEEVSKILGNIEPSGASAPNYASILKWKTWYLAPVRLKKIKKDVLGVSFHKNATQQIALQTHNAIWIDKKIYDRMSKQQQAELIIHELVMSLYFIKFISARELQNLILEMGPCPNGQCLDVVDAFDRAMPPEPRRPLNADDNENIRFVTSWLLQNSKRRIPETDFIKVLHARNFDRRFFRPQNYAKDPNRHLPELILPINEFIQALNGASLTDHLPNQCRGLATGTSRACALSFTIVEGSHNMKQLRITLVTHQQTLFDIHVPVGPEIKLTGSEDTHGRITYSLPIVDWRDQVRIGDRLFSGFLHFEKGTGPYDTIELKSAMIKPAVVISIDEKRDPVCLLRTPRATSLQDDGLLITRDGLRTSFVEQLYTQTPVFGACTPSNVVH